MKKLKIGSNYEFSDDRKNWEAGVLITVSTRIPITYQSKNFNKHEWYSNIRPVNKKPAYTQAMSDAGDLPEVGMKCLINFPDIDNCWYEYIIDFIGKHTLIASCEDVEERFSHLDDVYIKPIDTRTDKEKAVDDIYRSDLTVKENLAEAYDKWTGK